MIKSYNDIDVYRLSYEIAMDIFQITRKFPKEEMFSLTSQIVRSSRSISANIAEGWSRREYENVFKQFLFTSLGSATETEVWLKFSKDCNYITDNEYKDLFEKIETIREMLNKLHQNWQKF